MLVGDAREVARQWVTEHGDTVAGFCGAYFAGSTTWLAADFILPPGSDVDLMVVVSDPSHPHRGGKFIYRDVLLDVSYLSGDRLRSPDQVLGDYHLAGGLRTPSIVLDPSGHLTALQSAVSGEYARSRWVRRRCEDARSRVLTHLESLTESAPLHDQVTAWLFGTGVTTHVLLVAGLKNPTVRRRYVAVRELLAEYGRAEFHETLLTLLGSAAMSRERVEQHLTALASVFDAAASVIRTPFPFASDLTESARPIAIEGTRDLITRGLHREAVFWIIATYSRCQKVLHHDAPAETGGEYTAGYLELLADVGIATSADLRRRSQEVRRFLSRLWQEAEAIMAANSSIED